MSGNSVFISYSHRDVEDDWLQAFASALRERNVNVWLDVSDVQPGDVIADAAEKALRESDAIIAVISGNVSENSEVYFELGVALGAKKRLILVVDPSYATSMPFDLRRRKWVPVRAPEETASEVAEAIAAPK